jgi:glycosyltransferase involved in cell wall biosynthesis
MSFEKTVLQVIPSLNSGGAERTVLEMTQAILAAGGVPLIATSGGRMVPEIERMGGRIFRMPVQSKNPLTILANSDRLARLIRTAGVEIIHARSRAPGWSALWAARKTGIPYVATYHGAYEARTPFKRFYNSSLARADLVIANSEFTAMSVRRQFSVGDRLSVIPRGADLSVFDPDLPKSEAISAIRARWGIEDPKPLILLLPGRVTAWKGHQTAIEAMSLLRHSASNEAATGASGDFQLILAGDDQGRGRYAAALRRLVDELGLSRMIRWVGHCSDMATAYAASDIVLSPSTRPEAFGRVAAEAGAMERAVIAAGQGGACETVIDGETGVLVSPGSAEDLAQAIKRLAGLGVEGRRRMGARARSHIEARFSTEAMTKATIAAYQRLIDGWADRR